MRFLDIKKAQAKPALEARELFEILRTGLEERLVLLAGDVLAHQGTAALQMAHLTKDTAVGREDASMAPESRWG